MTPSAPRIGIAKVRPNADPYPQLAWTEITVVLVTDCDHNRSICAGCVTSWLADYEVDLADINRRYA